MKLEFSQQIFLKYSNTKFHENLSTGSRVILSGWTDRTDITKQTVACSNLCLKRVTRPTCCTLCLVFEIDTCEGYVQEPQKSLELSYNSGHISCQSITVYSPRQTRYLAKGLKAVRGRVILHTVKFPPAELSVESTN